MTISAVGVESNSAFKTTIDNFSTARQIRPAQAGLPVADEVLRRKVFRINIFAAFFVACLAAGGCSRERSQPSGRISPEYDKKTGRLSLLKYDSDGDGKVDTWSYMDGPRVLRIEIDTDQDGKIDRWEYYDADQKIEKVGLSREHDGREDAWQYFGPDAAVVRVDISTRRDGKVTRTEKYEQGRLVSAEEDTDGDGRIDKWETYDGERLASVAFDTTHRGVADRRIVYGADGTVAVEPIHPTR